MGSLSEAANPDAVAPALVEPVFPPEHAATAIATPASGTSNFAALMIFIDIAVETSTQSVLGKTDPPNCLW